LDEIGVGSRLISITVAPPLFETPARLAAGCTTPDVPITKKRSQVSPELKLTKEQENIYEEAKIYAETYRDACALIHNANRLAPIIKYLVKEGTITKNNMHIATLSLCILICAVVYDYIVEIPDALKLVNMNLNIKIKKSMLHVSLINLMQKHEMDLFLYPKFEFNSEIKDIEITE